MARHPFSRFSSLAATLSLAGCSAILGLDDFSDAGTGASGATGSSGSAQGGGGATGSATSSAGNAGSGTAGSGGVGPKCGNGVADPGELCFAPAVQLDTTALQASTLVLLDCDEDGDLDILASHEQDAILVALRNDGKGTFSDAVISDTFTRTWDFEVVDPAPNAQTLMFIGFPQRFVRLRRVPDQPCAFVQDSTYNLLQAGPRTIGVLDAGNSNTLPDVIVSTDNDGMGNSMQYAYDFAGAFPDFQTAMSGATDPYAIATGDVAGAGDDLVVTDLATRKVEVRQYYTGAGLLFPEVGEVGNNPIGLVVGDINGDFRDDAITANEADGTISILLNNGDEGFDKPGADVDITGGDPALGSPRDLALADLDGDGDRDLAIVSAFDGMGKSFVQVLVNAGGGTFSLATAGDGSVPFPAEVGRQPWAVRTGDLNGDGLPDIVTTNHFDGGTSSTVSILLSNP